MTYQPKYVPITKEPNASIHLLTVSLKIYTNISVIFLFALVAYVSKEIFPHAFPYGMVTFLKYSLGTI